MAADCADANAVVVRELQQSKHAAERAMVGADNMDDDDDAAAPVSDTKTTAVNSDRARLSGGQRAQHTRGGAKKSAPAPDTKPPLANERQAAQDAGPLRPRGKGLEGPVGLGGLAPASDSVAKRETVAGEDTLGRAGPAQPAAATLPGICAVAVGGVAVGLVAGMVLARR